MGMKIAFVTETYPPEVNGVAMTVGQLVRGMRARGHQVSVCRLRQQAGDGGGPDETLLPGLGMPGYPGVRFGLPAARRLRRLWREARPDLVHVVTEGPLGWSAVQVARELGLPVTSGFHTNFDSYSAHYGYGFLRPLLASYLRVLHRRTQATLVPTTALAAELAAAGVPGLRVVGRGVDVDRFAPHYRCPKLRAEWGAQPGDVVCLYVGRLAPEKNLGLAAAAFAAIRAGHSRARMVWVGDGPSLDGLRRDFPEQHFAGVRRGEDLARHYASADLFLFPSLSETYGNVVAEAMASGLPALAYRCAAAAELIESGRDGVTVLPGDERQFIEQARQLGCDGLLRRQLAVAAREKVLGRTWAAVLAAFESALGEVRAAFSIDQDQES